MNKRTRDFQTLLACAMLADDQGTFEAFFEGLSEAECTVFAAARVVAPRHAGGKVAGVRVRVCERLSFQP